MERNQIKDNIKSFLNSILENIDASFAVIEKLDTEIQSKSEQLKNFNQLIGNIVDKEKCSELLALALPMNATFHRAFDEVADSAEALEQIIEYGFSRILTSGQKPSAMEGAEVISELIYKANDRIIIMPGGGVRAENISELKRKTNAIEFHSSSINHRSMLPEENEIRKMKNFLS